MKLELPFPNPSFQFNGHPLNFSNLSDKIYTYVRVLDSSCVIGRLILNLLLDGHFKGIMRCTTLPSHIISSPLTQVLN